jgi:hypothetical protein
MLYKTGSVDMGIWDGCCKKDFKAAGPAKAVAF